MIISNHQSNMKGDKMSNSTSEKLLIILLILLAAILVSYGINKCFNEQLVSPEIIKESIEEVAE
jgi:uncharacterized membrane protein YphA (DoxX/SURF4 family)